MTQRAAKTPNPDAMVEGDEVRQAFARRLTAIRTSAGLSEEQLENRAFLLRGHVGVLERGGLAPGLTTLLRLADGLGVEPSELVDDLPTPFRSLGAEWAKLVIKARPGITTDGIVEATRLQRVHVARLVLMLEGRGMIVSDQGGWRLTTD